MISLNNFARTVNTKRLTAKTSYYRNRRGFQLQANDYCATACNAKRGIAKAFLSVCQSVKRVLCEKRSSVFFR